MSVSPLSTGGFLDFGGIKRVVGGCEVLLDGNVLDAVPQLLADLGRCPTAEGSHTRECSLSKYSYNKANSSVVSVIGIASSLEKSGDDSPSALTYFFAHLGVPGRYPRLSYASKRVCSEEYESPGALSDTEVAVRHEVIPAKVRVKPVTEGSLTKRQRDAAYHCEVERLVAGPENSSTTLLASSTAP